MTVGQGPGKDRLDMAMSPCIILVPLVLLIATYAIAGSAISEHSVSLIEPCRSPQDYSHLEHSGYTNSSLRQRPSLWNQSLLYLGQCDVCRRA